MQDAEACKDIIQDIFTDLWFRREQISNENPVGYLHTAVRFQVFKYIGRSAGKAFYEPLEAIMPAGGTASDPLDYKELLTLVEQWMDTLPEKRGEIFRLRYQEQLSTKAIAAKLHISQKTVQNQLGIAYNSLRDKLPGIIFFLLFDSAFRHIF
ncbi:RNA polymerase sigma-70 factor [Compostibacter hankyongensis]|uniref:RNA polymerase sigma-70 factor n=1 Tax=Compostibacter hankyongensis TaxID=1007089 RepID=A0ABP8FV84_9BACT